MDPKPEVCELKETQRSYLETIALSLRPATVINSRTAINSFIRYLKSEHPRLLSFAQLDRSHIEKWLRHLVGSQLKKTTRKNYVVKLKCFVERIQDWQWESAPGVPLFSPGDLPPEDKALPRPLSVETDRALKLELQRRGGLIHKALLFLRATGLRSKELMDLKVDSLRESPGNEWALHVPVGKLHSERMLPLEPQTALIFQEICKLRGSPQPVVDPETGKPAHFLLMRPAGRRFSRDALRYHLGKIEKEIFLKEHPSPHRLRHTFATEMLRAGLNLPVLMKLLGHRTIGMTLRYAEVTGTDIRRAYIETFAKIQGLYEIPTPPPLPARVGGSLNSIGSIVLHLKSLADMLESYRRDKAVQKKKKEIQRLVERLRRLLKDFKNATS